MVESSQYIPVRDGTLLAADIYRPAVDGQAVETPLPVILWFGRYHRDQMKFIFPWYETLIRYGYVIAAVDVRDSGASYGSTRTEHYSPNEMQDGYDVIEWLASQPWSDGNIGMFGASYMGRTQFEAASARPPHLKAIYPQVAYFDFYYWPYPGGILQSAYLPRPSVRTSWRSPTSCCPEW